jgi:uncharacterized protein YndB with AHSA1/START domain
MAEIIYKKSQVINAPVEKVFKTITEIENFPKWNPTTPVTRKISSGEPRQGSEFEMKIRGFGMVKQTLDEFEPNRQVMIVPHIKMLGGGHRFIFKKLSDSSTQVDHEMIMIPKGIFKLFSPMMKSMGRKNVDALADCLEKYLEGKD